jgi:DNA polymerase III subunit alpha
MPEEYAQKAKSMGHKALAVTDHGKLTAFYEHQLACEKYGIKPIFGVEAYITEKLEVYNEKEKRLRTPNNHIILLAKNETGYKNLLYLNYLSHKDTEHFYYFNRISIDELFEYKDGLIVTTACMKSPFGEKILNDDLEGAELLFKRFKDEFGDDFYTEIQLNEFSKENEENNAQWKINTHLLEFSEKYDVKKIIGGDVHYLNKGDDKLQSISIAIRNKEALNDMSFEIESKNLYYHDVEDFVKFNKEFGYNYKNSDIIEWCHNTVEIADKCNYLMPKRKRMYLPKLTEDDDYLLIEKAKEGLVKKLKVDSYKEVPEEYKKRLNKEAELVIRKGFSSYMMILWDLFRHLKRVGVFRSSARGSAGGSLLAYSLDITTLDPIKYGLIFERFLSNERTVDYVYNYFGE